jgi:hypothetical protein
VFKSGWGYRGLEGEFLAGKRRKFDELGNSVGEGVVLVGLECCFFPWAFFMVTRLGPGLKFPNSIEIEPGNKLEFGAVMEQVPREEICGIWCATAC